MVVENGYHFFMPMDNLFGRTTLYTSLPVIDKTNVVQEVKRLELANMTNVSQMNYLWHYYKGRQDILDRTKQFNDYVLNKICENRAKEIVDFKTAYLAGDAIKYSANNNDYSDAVDKLNDFCRLEGKETADYELVEWMNIVGTSFRLILPKQEEVEEHESPFIIETLNPMNAFVAYTSKIPHKPKLACYMTYADGVVTYSVYVANPDGNLFFEIVDGEITDEQPYPLNVLPIIEYPKGKARIGAFECVKDLLDAVNTLDSNRLDGVEQAIQTLLVLVNCKLPDGMTASKIKEMGLIELLSNEANRASVEQITTNLDQTQTQTLKEDLLQAIRTIVSMPNTSAGGSSGGDNGLAVLYRNGWEGAYESAMTDQKNMDRSEMQAIKLMLEICNSLGSLDLPIRYVNIDYTRQHYENMATKAQVLISMLNNDKIHPATAYEVCGLFYDPNKKYMDGMQWFEERQAEAKAVAEQQAQQLKQEEQEEPTNEEDGGEAEETEV